MNRAGATTLGARAWASWLVVASLALTLTSEAKAQGLGMAPVPLAAVPVISVAGGAATTVMLAMDIAEDRPTHPAVRNIGLGLGITNTVLGALGITATAVTGGGDFAAIAYAVSGLYLALGLTGGGLALASDVHHSSPATPVPDTRPGAQAISTGRMEGIAPRAGVGFALRLAFP